MYGGQGYGGGGFQPPNGYGQQMPQYPGGMPMQQGGMGMHHPNMGMHPGATEFVPGGFLQGTPGASPYMQPGQQAAPPVKQRQPELPPTDEEQAWLEAQMEKEREPKESLPEAPAAAEPDGGYEDVMKMIEDNRRKNEAKRAAQSARNAEIIAAFEARTGSS